MFKCISSFIWQFNVQLSVCAHCVGGLIKPSSVLYVNCVFVCVYWYILPRVYAMRPSVGEGKWEICIFLPPNVCACVCVGQSESRPVSVCKWMWVAVTVRAHICLCVGLESSARPHWPVSGRKHVSESILCLSSLVLPQINLHTVISLC